MIGMEGSVGRKSNYCDRLGVNRPRMFPWNARCHGFGDTQMGRA